MDSFEWNKIIGAVLGAVLFLLVIRIAAEVIYEPEKPAKPGYVVEGVVEEGATATAEKPEEMPDWGTVLASADVAAGKNTSQRCLQCHTLGKGEPNKIGPNIYAIVDDARGEGRAGFSFSSAMKGKGGTWTFDDLNKFIASPKGFVPGTAMGFAGISKDSERADVIAYLATLAEKPVPLPTAAK
jgi:cytochrome c